MSLSSSPSAVLESPSAPARRTLLALAAVYVVCNLIGLIARVIGRTPLGDAHDLELVEAVAYFPLQFLLLSIYMPLAVRPLHRVSRWRLLLAVLMWGALFVIAGIILFFVVGQPMASRA